MTVVFECFFVYLVEVNCSCPPVVGEIYHLTCFPLWGVYLPSRFASVSGWMILPLTQHSLKSIFLQILLPFSKFSLLQLVLISCLTLTSQFSSFLSIPYSPSLAT